MFIKYTLNKKTLKPHSVLLRKTPRRLQALPKIQHLLLLVLRIRVAEPFEFPVKCSMCGEGIHVIRALGESFFTVIPSLSKVSAQSLHNFFLKNKYFLNQYAHSMQIVFLHSVQ